MKKFYLLLAVVAILTCPATVFAIIRLPPIMSSNMVLQQNSKANLWGWADPSERFTITSSWKTKPDTVTAMNSGKWKAAISTPSFGGPYTITIKGRSNTVVLENILIGEVWLCSGQSNMEVSNTQSIKNEGAKANNPKIRLFTVAKVTSETPQDYAGGNWVECSEESVKRFSAIAYHFAAKIQQELGGNVPIGLIQSAWSGTPVELWEPQEVLDRDPDTKLAATKVKDVTYRPNKPGLIYNAMIYPISNYSIAGVIWYQGEGNTYRANTYRKMFTGMIGEWRKQFNQDFPFYFIQIAPYSKYDYTYDAALLMEAQTQSLAYPKTGMVVITDLVDNVADQHPKDKLTPALRLANLALADHYKKPIAVYNSPMYKRMEVSKGKINLYFDNAPNGFMVKGDKPTEFLIAGADQKFLPADVKVEKDKIVASNPQIANPVAVRFSFANDAMANIFNKEGLPVNPFRTDNWEIKGVEIKK
jgi:sialate O-acetylesterase